MHDSLLYTCHRILVFPESDSCHGAAPCNSATVFADSFINGRREALCNQTQMMNTIILVAT